MENNYHRSKHKKKNKNNIEDYVEVCPIESHKKKIKKKKYKVFQIYSKKSNKFYALKNCSGDSDKHLILREFYINKIIKNLINSEKLTFTVNVFKGNIILPNKKNKQNLNDFKKHESNKTEMNIFMDLWENDLSKILNSKTKISRDECVLIMFQCLLGLAQLHACGIVHVDIKPENILINDVLDIGYCDFGSADYINPFNGRSKLEFSFSDSYASPEFLEIIFNKDQNSIGFDFKHDIWSLGNVFFELYQKIRKINQIQNFLTLINRKKMRAIKNNNDLKIITILKNIKEGLEFRNG